MSVTFNAIQPYYPQPITAALQLFRSAKSAEMLGYWGLPPYHSTSMVNILGLLCQKHQEILDLAFTSQVFDSDIFGIAKANPTIFSNLQAKVYEAWNNKAKYSVGIVSLAIDLPSQYYDAFTTIAASTAFIFDVLDSLQDSEQELTAPFDVCMQMYQTTLMTVCDTDSTPSNPFLLEPVQRYYKNLAPLLDLDELKNLGELLVATANLAHTKILNLMALGKLTPTALSVMQDLTYKFCISQSYTHCNNKAECFSQVASNRQFPVWVQNYFTDFALDSDGSMVGYYALLADCLASETLEVPPKAYFDAIYAAYSYAHNFYHVLLNDAVGVYKEDQFEGSLIYCLVALVLDKPENIRKPFVASILQQIWEEMESDLQTLTVLSSGPIHRRVARTLYVLYSLEFKPSVNSRFPSSPKLALATEVAVQVMEFFAQKTSSLIVSNSSSEDNNLQKLTA